MAAIALAAFASTATSASAAGSHAFKEIFGSAVKPEVRDPRAIAVDHSTGDLYVADGEFKPTGSQHLSRFKPNGEPQPFAALGTHEIDGEKGPGGKPCAEEPASCDALPEGGFSIGGIQSFGGSAEMQIAIDESGTATDGNVYLTQTGAKQIDIFAADGSFLGQLRKAGAKNLGEICGVAVGPNGNVYVSSYTNNTVYRYGAVGAFPTNGDGSPFTAAVTKPCSLAIGRGPSAGSLFVNRFKGAIYKIELASGELKGTVAEGPAPAPNSGLVTIAMDATNGHLFAGYESEVNEFDVTGGPSGTLLSTIKIKRRVAAVAADEEIYVGWEGTLAEVPPIGVYGAPIVSAPQATTGAASAIASTSATLNGTVDPEGAAITECFFEYGPTASSYDHTVPCVESEAEIGSGTAPVAVKASVTGLSVNGTVNFRLVAESSAGFQAEGANESFNTAPIAETLQASNITDTTATLNGVVSPDGAPITECFFEYGLTAAPYEHTVPCVESEAEIGSGTAPVAVHAPVAGLAPKGTMYHVRLVAAGVNGTGQGKDLSFQTPIIKPVITGTVSPVGATTATLNGTVNPEGGAVDACLFEYGTAGGPTEGTVPCAESESAIGAGTDPVPVHADISGLEPGRLYRFHLTARILGTMEDGAEKTFRTAGPSVDAAWAVEVGRTGAELAAEINPQGSGTSFFVEYGPTDEYGESTLPSNSIGSDDTAHTVSVDLEDLDPGTMYHYRFVAVSRCNPSDPNEECVSFGADTILVTYTSTLPPLGACPNDQYRLGASAGLPNCRAYEMVSPVDKAGSDAEVSFTFSLGRPARLDQAAADGERLTFSTYRAFADPVSSPYSSQYMAERQANAGWVTRNISPPQEGRDDLELGGLNAAYKGFSEDLCSGWMLQGTELLLAPGAVAGFPNLYQRDNCGAKGYEAISRGTATGVEHGVTSEFPFIPAFKGSSADASKVFFTARGGLAPDATATEQQLYESVGGTLKFVCYLPDGSPSSDACSAGSGAGDVDFYIWDASIRDAVSSDGSRVYWTSGGGLYLRIHPEREPTASGQCEPTEPEKACTMLVDSSVPITFWDAALDGSKALYSVGEEGLDAELLEFDAADGPDSASAVAGDFYGVMGASDDLGKVYFASGEVLSGGPNGEGQSPVAGQPNLYLYEADAKGGAGEYLYIATLSSRDFARQMETFSTRPIDAQPFYRASRVSPSGRHATFVTDAGLTGYDNTDQHSGAADLEVFLYDAPSTTEEGPGELRCVSCNPSGARPTGRDIGPDEAGGSSPDWMAAHIPGWESSLHPSRVLSVAGDRLFFESFEALVQRDTNGSADVYQWERGDSQAECQAQGAEMFLIREGGCLSLISSGQNRSDSAFVDASVDGRDVYFTTSASLVPQDPGLADIYDARDGGGFAAPAGPPAACEGEACQGPPSPPNDPTPASLTFRGAGNVKNAGKGPCAKRKVRRKGRCVAKKHHKKHKRANHHRGGKK